jgi:hypothetical protein
MPKRSEVGQSERLFLEKRLGGVLKALREDQKLCDEFLFFVSQRGGSASLTLERLKTVWWPSRKSMYPGFFVLALADFGLAHGLYGVEKPEGRSRKRETAPQ